MKTTEFVINNHLSWDILSSYGLHETGNKHITCPICGEKKKFRIASYNGLPSWICTCGNGDMWSLLLEITGKSFADLASEIDKKYGNTQDKTEFKPKQKNDEYENLFDVRNTEVEKYLNGRGITKLPDYGVYFKPQQYHKETRQTYNCMHAIATDPFFQHAMIHQTYIQNRKKINHDAAKKMFKLREAQNIPVRMFLPAGSTLGVGEGIESSLSACQIFDVSTWATLSKALLKKFRAPKGVKHLYIFSDYETHGAGLAAAFECANMNLLCKNDVIKVTVKWTELGDFNDLLQNPGHKVYKMEFTR